MIINLFFYLFSGVLLMSSLMFVFSQNSIYSVLFLVLTFVNVSSLLFFLVLDYLPLVFIVVYVGALAVLFIFVMMMLNIRISDLKENNVIIPNVFNVSSAAFCTTISNQNGNYKSSKKT